MSFVDRADAGRRLAARLGHLAEREVVVGLPRGGVPVAFEVARALRAPLDVVLVRKLGVPSQPELGMGAIGEDGTRVVNRAVTEAAGITDEQLRNVEARERRELEWRAERLRRRRPRIPLDGRRVVVVDDGLATGSTARAACEVARAHGAAHVVLAVPVAPLGWEERLEGAADELLAVETPDPFFAIGQFYGDFSPTSDDEVVRCLERARTAVEADDAGPRSPANVPELSTVEVDVPAGAVQLGAQLAVPAGAWAVVVLAHRSAGSRHGARSRAVAATMERAGMASLSADLLAPAEVTEHVGVPDVELLTQRLVATTRWLAIQPSTRGLAAGCFVTGTGAGVALRAAASPGSRVAAVVSCAGRPNLAGLQLEHVTAPTLLIVGPHDEEALELNWDARSRLGAESRLVVVPGATHRLEEPRALAAVAMLARDWFVAHLAPERAG